MIWIDGEDHAAPRLPAVWLVATGAAPADLRERSQLRRETAQRVLARQLQRPAGTVSIEHLPGGRPVPAGAAGLHLSLATRAGVVAVALAGAAVGVDVEQVQPDAPIPWAALHPLEQHALRDSSGPDRARRFALLWAAKEAYVKALGTGFVRAPESFAVMLLDGRRFRVSDVARQDEPEGETRLTGNGGGLALAAAVIVPG